MRNLYFLIVMFLCWAVSLTAQNSIINKSDLPDGSREQTCSGNLRQLLSASMGRVGDIDNDGKNEIICWSQTGNYDYVAIYWYVYQYNETSQNYEVEYISDLIAGTRVLHVSLIDLDSDGTIEIVMELENKGIDVIDGVTKERKYNFRIKYPNSSGTINVKKILKVDADNDGITEILLVSDNYCGLYLPSATGLNLKSFFPIGGSDARVGNVDNNPDNELVLVDRVFRITGDDYELLWTIPDSWSYSKTELIDIDGDNKKEILNNRWRFTAWNGDSHDTIYQVYLGSVTTILTKDTDGDGKEEIFHDANSKINCINSSSGEEIWSFINPGDNAYNLGVSDLDNDGEDEIYWTGDASFSGTAIYVYDLATKTPEWKSTDTDGPFSRVRVGDVDNDNSPELITLAAKSEDGYGEPVMTILDAATNNLEWQSSTELFNWANEGVDFRIADIDDDDTTEIIVAGLRGRIYVVNGITKRLERNKGFSNLDFIHSLAIADTDNDGNVELITCNSRKVVLIDPVDWVIEWQSPETTNYGDGFYKADVGNIDSDAAPEMIFLHSNVLTVFDGITHAATEIGRTDITSFAFYDKNNDGISELYIGTLNGKVGMITVDSVNWTGIVTGKRINDLNVVDLLSAPGEEFIFMSDGRLWTSSQEGKSQCSKTISDVASMYDCIELTDYNEDGKTEIFTGTSYMVSEMSYECYKCAAMDINLQAGHLTCGHGNDGSVASIVNNAIAPITYAWNNGETSQDLSGLAAGVYTLTATDGVGCEDVDSIKVEQLYLQAYIHATRKGCTDAFPGEIATEIIVGQPPYTYHWNNGSADPSLINPPDGEYTVLITDANNCTRQLSAPMIKDTLILDAKIMQINCHDGGSIEIMASGYPPYTYNWSDGYHQPSRIEPEPGNYSITVNDMYGCTATKEILFEQYTELGANVFSFCDNPSTPEYDGAVLLEPFGGAPPYTINWSIIPEPENPLRVTGLIPDEYYSFSITDAANCQYNDYVEVTNGMLIREGKAYPNPAHDFVTIDLSENFIPFKKATADFYNINGVKELSVNLSSPITVVDLMHLGSGLYIVKINIDGIDTMLKMERIKHKKKE